MQLFKDLGDIETAEFKQWARDNYQPFQPISGLWHPVIQAECAAMNNEAGANLPSF